MLSLSIPLWEFAPIVFFNSVNSVVIVTWNFSSGYVRGLVCLWVLSSLSSIEQVNSASSLCLTLYMDDVDFTDLGMFSLYCPYKFIVPSSWDQLGPSRYCAICDDLHLLVHDHILGVIPPDPLICVQFVSVV